MNEGTFLTNSDINIKNSVTRTGDGNKGRRAIKTGGFGKKTEVAEAK